MLLLGLDPGGKKNFGWARLIIDGSGTPASLETGVASSVLTAISEATRGRQDIPEAVGIDAPLYWVIEGDRTADATVRRRVCAAGGNAGTVGHVNSLRGACLVQGVLAARQVSEKWPAAKVTEAHPKALLISHSAAGQFLEPHSFSTDHERDSAIAAYAAWMCASASNGWEDLVLKERAPFFPSGHPVIYWFPSSQTQPGAGVKSGSVVRMSRVRARKRDVRSQL
jgi:hypothetical protein